MKLIVGLGNPGLLYSGTRHNIGFEVIKRLAHIGKIALKKEKGIRTLVGRSKEGFPGMMLAMPLTFMNLSGEAVSLLVKRYKIEIPDLLVVCDDMDLGFSRIKISPKGSSAGHRGIQSIIDHLKVSEFNRLRLGIGRPGDATEASDFVLSRFSRKEKSDIPMILDNAVECCWVWKDEGCSRAMNLFNPKITKGELDHE
jgi:PTH1 family peptidyl-tRNA hydrolase